MKFLLSFILFMNTAYALELKKVKKLGDIRYEIKIDFLNSEIESNSNYFNLNEEKGIGKYSFKKDATKESAEKLESILKTIKSIDSLYNAQGKNFNDVATQSIGWLEYFEFEGYLIYQNFEAYGDLETIFNFILTKKITLKDVIKINLKSQKIEYYKDNKLEKSEDFNQKFNCEKEVLPTKCFIKDYGHYFIEGK